MYKYSGCYWRGGVHFLWSIYLIEYLDYAVHGLWSTCVIENLGCGVPVFRSIWTVLKGLMHCVCVCVCVCARARVGMGDWMCVRYVCVFVKYGAYVFLCVRGVH